jgi:hypothetical protein
MNTNKMDFSQRNAAIDILRALTVWLMIFVNDFWSVRGVPQWMQHAARGEDFLGLADVVYPVFLFVVGMSIPYALESRFKKGLPDTGTLLHILSRFFALLIMGAFTEQTLSGLSRDVGMTMPIWKSLMVVGFFLVWNTYPRTDNLNRRRLYIALQILGVLLLVYLAVIFRDREGRLLRGSYGILGSIGWAYLFCAVVYMFVRNNVPKLFFFWLAILLFLIARSNPPQLIPREANLLSDLIGIVRIGSTTLLTMGGVLFSLLIVKYAHLEARKKIIYLVSLAAVVLIASIISHQYWIVAKLGSTIPWVLYCSAITIATYGILHWMVVKGKASWFNVIKAGGTATLSCYVMPYFLQGFFYSFNYGILPGSINSLLPDWAKADFFGLVKCALWALLCIGFTALLQRFKIQLKI